ncbi:putative hemagglutinin-related protein (fragment) [Sterolibacterium denitrificans]|uniref:Hemagglutinin-related protein n=1 Tax=Sterolibacterium denitrificans TaxID=157592 RepID=A0A7Z7HNY7_9PROT
MNAHCYRIIFNKRRGLLMAVAETAPSRGKARSVTTTVATSGKHPRRLSARLKPLARLVWRALGWASCLGGLLVSAAHAQIVADPGAPGNQRPTVLNAFNGVSLVNIQTPSAAGVSRNAYQQFDVQTQGAILNNSHANVQTQLGGWVQGNPWLATGSARVILNEVHSSDPSLLQGYLEVAGPRAQVVIANPAGVSCDGCGFINAHRATLTTGEPILDGGRLAGYRVQEGTVSITGLGLDAGSADYTEILARAVQIHAGLWAHQLAIVAGANQIDVDPASGDAQVTGSSSIAGIGPAPTFAIDTALLGGMYAGKISLIASEAGVGVRHAGKMYASVGDVVITANGRLENAGHIASGGDTRIRIDAQDDVQNTGIIYAQGNLSLDTRGDIDNTSGGAIIGNAAASIEAGALDNRGGQIQAAGPLDITLSGVLDNTRSLVRSGQALRISATGIINTHTQSEDESDDQGLEGETIVLNAARIDNAGGAIRANRDATLTSDGLIDNAAGLISAGNDLTLRDPFAETAPAHPTLAIANTGGTLIAGRQLRIDGAGLSGDGNVLSQGDLNLTLRHGLANTGQIIANGNASVETAAALSNQGLLAAAGSLTARAATLDNQAGGTISAARIDLQAGDGHTLTNRGLINGGETLLRSQTLDNLGTGRIYGDHVAIGASTLNNRAEDDIAPVIAARERLDIGALAIDNSGHALLFSGGDIAIGGSLDDGHRATSQAEILNNASARIEAMGALEIAARTLDNTNQDFSTAIETLAAQSITEYQGAGSPNRYAPDAPDVYIYNDESDHLHTPEGNHESWSAYRYTRTTTETRVQTSDPASITAGGDLRITADTVNNDKSHIIAGGTLSGTIGTLNNTEVAGERVITDAGTVTSYWRNHEKGRDNTGSSMAGYLPAPTIQAISLTPTVYLQNTAPASSGTTLAALTTTRLGQAPAAVSSAAGTTPIVQILLPGSSDASDPADVVRSGGIDTRVPDSRLFGLTPDPAAPYLIETDPAFADYRTWLSSDYLLAALALDPATTQKRLGDGYYEQKLIREQVAQLTGRRFLAGHADDEAQYAALMDNGLTFAQAYDLIPGVALSAAQMAALTSDIVWLVAQDVTLADGSTTQALVPQVYVRLQEGDLQAGGALIAGQDVRLDLSGDLFNGGTIAGRQLVAIDAENLHNLQGRILGNTVQVAARADLDNIGGLIAANEALLASAGRDLTVESTTRSQHNAQGSQTNVERIAGLYVTAAEGVLLASARRDMNLIAAAIQNQGAGRTQLIAQRNLTLGTVTQGQSQSIVWDAGNRRDESRAAEVGTRIATQGDLRLAAGQDLAARAAEVGSQAGALAVAAGQDLTIAAGMANVQVDEAHQHTGRSSAFSSKTLTTRDTLDQTTAILSAVSGETLSLTAGNDVAVRGSNLVSDAGTTLAAGRDLTIEAATETTAESHFRDEKKSGLFSTGGLGITIGTQQQSIDQQGLGQTAAASTVGSVQGDVTLLAGAHYRQTGSDVLAPQGDVSIAAQAVEIEAARETSQSRVEQQFKQSGLTVSLGSPVISAVQTVQQVTQAAGDTRDGRMQALAAASAGLAGYQGYQAVVAGQAVEGGNLADQAGGVSLAVSLGSSKSQSTSTQTSDTAAGSTVAAGGDVTILAMGNGEKSDITVQGSSVSAGRNVHLLAEDEIKLLAAANTGHSQSNSTSSSASVGVSLNLGAQTGLSVGVAASKGTGRADGQDTAWTNARLSAGETASLASGGDTTLKGAVIEAPQVIADVGGNLTIESLQDTSTYDSQQHSSGFSISVPIGPGMASGSISSDNSKAKNNYASVAEQSGILAGDGGFDITVKSNTDLKGAAIASSDKAIEEQKNRLTTATLTTSDIENRAEASASSSGFGIGTDMLTQGKYGITKGILSNALNNAKDSESNSGQTRTAVSDAAIILTNEDEQLQRTVKNAWQTVASLNRDVATAHTAAERIDTEKLEKTVEAERSIKQETIKAVTTLSDEAYRSRFQQKPTLLKVECHTESKACINDPSLLVLSVATEEDVANAPAGTIIAINGILNDEKRGAELAYQNTLPDEITKEKPTTVYLMHIAPANNTLSELMGVAYEKITASADYGLTNFLGYTNGQELYANLLRSRGDLETTSLGHSRGTLIQEASFTIVTNRLDENGNSYTNPNLTIRGVAGAANAEAYSQKAIQVVEEKNKDQVMYNYFNNDPVSVTTGGNVGFTTLLNLWEVYKTNNSMHSCMGTGAAGCKQVEMPVPGGPQGTPEGNAKLIEYVGGVRKPQPSVKQ